MNGQDYVQLPLSLNLPDQPICSFPAAVRTAKDYFEHFKVCSQCRTRFDK